MMNKKLILTILLAVMFSMNGLAQEYLTGFNGGIPQQESQKSRDEVVATLPFFDDFTTQGIYPDAKKWEEGNTFVNSGFPYMPVNYRALTLDVVDKYGKVYSHGSSNPFVADTLMSVKIRLDSVGNHALTPADSLYFSFYYQPGGFGDSPERDDSLVLQFGYNGQWKQMWASEGIDFKTFTDSLGENQYFKKVMIPIVDTCFFKDDFRILFFNYGTLPTQMYPNDRSNMDEWNIDLVYLDMNRSINGDTYPKVSFTNTPFSYLKRYKAMPYKHYKENPINEIDNTFDIYLTNMDSLAHEVRYSCEIEDNNSGWKYSYPNSAFPGSPLVVNQYDNVGVVHDSIVMGNFIYPYNSNADTTSFTIRHHLEVVDAAGNIVEGDSMVSQQGFYNYFAYDDGTPEKGYGLVPADTYFAQQFEVSKLDTVSGVQMLFNRTYDDANYNFFEIVIWRDNNGKPGEEIYRMENVRPKWDDNKLYAFSNYVFGDVVKVNSTFYVGIRQMYNKSINIGFDTSVDNSKYVFYDSGSGWQNTSFKGSLMIRPVMGKDPYFIGIEETSENSNALVLYPNPARNMVRIAGVDSEACDAILIFDITGRLVSESLFANELSVADLNNGVYMLRVINKDGSFQTSKLLISK